MRIKKSIINVGISILSLLITFVPNMVVRKLFLDSLGNEILGLVSLYSNISSWLCIIEMGIGSAIIFSLYKPYYTGDYNKVSAYIKYYKKFYRYIAVVLLFSSIVIAPYIRFFINENINTNLVSTGFILFMFNTFMSYMFSYRFCILNVAQESYKITISVTLSKLIISILQILILNIYPNIYIYLLIQILVNLVYYLNINKYIYIRNKNIFELNGSLSKLERAELTKNTGALFMHNIGSLVMNSTDNILISKYIGLNTLAKYTNYQIILAMVQNVVASVFNGITASIGNLISESDNKKIYNTFKNITFVNFWLTSFLVITLYNTLEQFIIMWVGKENLIDRSTFIILLLNIYIWCMRRSVEIFKSAGGIFYQDKYAPIFESLINLSISIYLVNKVGLVGIFLGTMCSNLLVVFWIKPYVLYKYLFKKNVLEYFYIYFKYLLIASIPLFITDVLVSSLKNNYNFNSFIINCIANIFIINSIYIIIFHKNNEFKYFKDIFINIIQKIRGKR